MSERSLFSVTNGTPLRHRRIWLSAATQASDVSGGDPSAVAALLEWVRCGNALVGRARQNGDVAGSLPIGLALPPRTRLSFNVAATAVDRVAAPLCLCEVAASLPVAMRYTAVNLAREAGARAMPLFVYGSVFWQHTSGGTYLNASSDLDLLAQPASAAKAHEWIGVLQREQAIANVRIDGEIELPMHVAVAWREMASDEKRLLVKSDLGPALWPRERVWSAWSFEEATRC